MEPTLTPLPISTLPEDAAPAPPSEPDPAPPVRRGRLHRGLLPESGLYSEVFDGRPAIF